MTRLIRVLVLTLAVFTAGTLIVYSQGKKGQVQDPVCGLWVDKVAELSVEHQGQTYYFCSNKDRDLFKANPAKYLPKK